VKRMIFCLLGWPLLLGGQPQLVPLEPAAVFAGDSRRIEVVWHNPGDAEIAVALRARVLQTSSATVVPVIERPWKTLRMLPRQTAIESALLDFPGVVAVTRFLVQWRDDSLVYGTSEVFVYPAEGETEALKAVLKGRRLGLANADAGIKAFLEHSRIEFTELATEDLKSFSGDVIVVRESPFNGQVPAESIRQVAAAAERGVTVLMLTPPVSDKPGSKEIIVAAPLGRGRIVIVPEYLVINLSADPLAQTRLLRSLELALNPNRFPLANLIQAP
jgi:hypothetical protein